MIVVLVEFIFMNERKIRIQFFKKLLTYYFVFGYICALGIVLLIFASVFTYRNFAFPQKFVALFFALCSLPVIGQFLRIVFSTKYKYRYYRLSMYRLSTRGYKDSYFECEMHEPCFRLIIKDMLISNGYSNEYALLRDKCHGRNLRVERAKENLLAKVKYEHYEF